MDVRVGLWRKLSTEELMLLNCGVGEDSWESLGLQGDPTSPSSRKSVLNIQWKDWCWSWNSNTLATWCKGLTHWKRPWCWERLKVGEEGGNRGWDGWMASLIQWTWVWVNSESWWWIGKHGVLQFMGSQRVRHNWATELNWTKFKKVKCLAEVASEWKPIWHFIWPCCYTAFLVLITSAILWIIKNIYLVIQITKYMYLNFIKNPRSQFPKPLVSPE